MNAVRLIKSRFYSVFFCIFNKSASPRSGTIVSASNFSVSDTYLWLLDMNGRILKRESVDGIQYDDLIERGIYIVNLSTLNTVSRGHDDRLNDLSNTSGGHACSTIYALGHIGEHAFDSKRLANLLGPLGEIDDAGMSWSDEAGSKNFIVCGTDRLNKLHFVAFVVSIKAVFQFLNGSTDYTEGLFRKNENIIHSSLQEKIRCNPVRGIFYFYREYLLSSRKMNTSNYSELGGQIDVSR